MESDQSRSNQPSDQYAEVHERSAALALALWQIKHDKVHLALAFQEGRLMEICPPAGAVTKCCHDFYAF